MNDCGYTSEELYRINKNQQDAIAISQMAMIRVKETLELCRVRPSDLEMCVEYLNKGLTDMERILDKNPLPICDRKHIVGKKGEQKYGCKRFVKGA